MARRHEDWIAQARIDLKVAQENARAGRFEWSCFVAQQCAEKAAEALHERRGAEAWGHGVLRLLETLEPNERPGKEILDAAPELDRHYVPARHPNGFESGYPSQYFGEADAKRAVSHAEGILRHCEAVLARP
ncbi:MAG: HEPN domain-containing protein [Planctomycetes bacterium]|nr:HEPN domain-containing protein [Planctomycetota bacterium]